LEEIFLPDITAIVSGKLREFIRNKKDIGKIVVHLAIVDYLEKMAREGKSQGIIGLDEIRLLRISCENEGIGLEYVGEIPSTCRGIMIKDENNVNKIIRLLALEWNGILITCDKIQYNIALAEGIKTIYIEDRNRDIFILEKFFDEDVMSVHLKENVLPYVKRGVPGRWRFEIVRNSPMTHEEMEDIIRNIFEVSKNSKNSFIEADRLGSTIIQLKNYRIVITRPPFSDGLEITAVRPVKKLSIYDYNIPDKLFSRLDEKAEGILVAGAPGMGKTTFVQALAEYYTGKGKVVKTIEAPRDMQLPDTITQYSKNYASSEEIHDVLLLSRPDYTVFDEMRDTKDFELFADLRLAGVGMIGVIHATTPIDAIQRFIGRVELGVIPSIIDTVIFIENGAISKVYEVSTTIKIPYGLKEEDLARPVVVVSDFLTNEPEYELYVFGERTFVVPIRRKRVKHISNKMEVLRRAIARSLKKYVVEEDIDLEMISENKVIVYIDAEYLSIIPGKSRRKLERIGRKMGIRIDIKPRFSKIA